MEANSMRLETELVLDLLFSAALIQFVRNKFALLLISILHQCKFMLTSINQFYFTWICQKLGRLWVRKAQNIQWEKKKKEAVLLGREPLLDFFKPLFQCMKKPPAKPLIHLIFLFTVKEYQLVLGLYIFRRTWMQCKSTALVSTSGAQRSGCTGAHWAWQCTWMECSPTPRASLMVSAWH